MVRRILSFGAAWLLLCAGATACTEILGDDYVLVDDDDDDGSGNTSGPAQCDGSGDCFACAQCACPQLAAECSFGSGAACDIFFTCAETCVAQGGTETDCQNACAAQFPDGAQRAVEFTQCAQGNCPSDCAL